MFQGMFSSLREPLAIPSSIVFSESWSSLRGETWVNTDCKWLLLKFARSVLDIWTSLVTGDVTLGSWSQMTEPTPWTASDDLMMSYPFML